MDLTCPIAAPTLDRGEDEIGLLLEDCRAASLDGFERLLSRTDDTAIGTRSCDDGNGFDDAQVAFKIGRTGRIGSDAWVSRSGCFIAMIVR